MNKIYQYELRRILRSKFFWGLLAVCLFFGWNILQTSTIRGVAHTAPFSPWSFGAYMARILPLLGVALLFFQWNQCNEKSRQFGRLTDAAPVEQGKYLLVKCAAAVTNALTHPHDKSCVFQFIQRTLDRHRTAGQDWPVHRCMRCVR